MSTTRSKSDPSPSPEKVVVLFRGVNVGGRNMLRMADLAALLGRLGYGNPKTLLQSGNAVVEGPRSSSRTATRQMEARIQDALTQELRVESDVFVRTPHEWAALIAANPFVDEAVSDPAHLIAMVLNAAPSAAAVEALQASIKGREILRHADRQLYIVYPDGQGTSKFTGSVIERALGVRGTARNWNTVLKLMTMLSA